MNAYTSSGSFKPFDGLKTLLKNSGTGKPGKANAKGRNRPVPEDRRGEKTPTPQVTDSATREHENEMFQAAMADVTPIGDVNCAPAARGRPPAPTRGTGTDPDSEAVHRLRRLVDFGEGFVVAQTSEYMQGTGCGVHPEIAKRLHRGTYAIQGHIDLHGYTAAAAQEVFDAFLKESIAVGRRAILIVHGRGLSCQSKSVLKSCTYQWLTHGPWRKWVLAFTSARLVDGGTGATIVLLRQHPQTKSQKKKIQRIQERGKTAGK